MKINPKKKGYRGEALAVDLMKKLGFKDARRGLSQSLGALEADVVSSGTSAYWIEVKNQQGATKVWEWLEQAERDSKNTPKIPLVLYKSNNKKFLVIGDAEYLLPILCNHT